MEQISHPGLPFCNGYGSRVPQASPSRGACRLPQVGILADSGLKLSGEDWPSTGRGPDKAASFSEGVQWNVQEALIDDVKAEGCRRIARKVDWPELAKGIDRSVGRKLLSRFKAKGDSVKYRGLKAG
ncbi:unnamed protein product [Symbiodinium sp. CCMP2456]|nr:unnamed protein product [Symbiodinium sp. CCMP2456]